MAFYKSFKDKYPKLFTYQKSDEIHLHDHLVASIFIRWMPKWITPNRLSFFRIIATPVVFSIVLFSYYKLGVLLFLLVAFTDVLDGSMARTRHQITKFGMLLDPLADKLLIGSMVLLLVFRYLHFWLAFSVLGMEIVFIVAAVVAEVKFKTIKMANLWGKIKMNLQVIAVCTILMALLLDFPVLLTVSAWIFGLALGFAVVSLFRHGV